MSDPPSVLPEAVLLAGPTCAGKTALALELAERYPVEIVSVDSAQVYREMDVGTSKPSATVRGRVPHHLIDICDPAERYNAGQFRRDALALIPAIRARKRVPLLVGGTMLYFRALTEGIADLPPAAEDVRADIDRQAAAAGWPALHAELERVDPVAAERINPNDSQRIQRALEVFRSSGKSLTAWQQEAAASGSERPFIKVALEIEPRSLLHARIEKRLEQMVENGFIEELRGLRKRPGLTADSPSMRAVGYRQYWKYLDGDWSLEEAFERALFATRQLAKRQLTWLRSEQNVFFVDALEADAINSISEHLARHLS